MFISRPGSIRCRCAEFGQGTILFAVALAALAAPARGDTITLQLGDPQYCECGWVAVNGYVQSSGPLQGLVWDWGDGSRTVSWFPASHRYAADGTYDLVVTAVGCTNETDTATVNVAGTGAPGCPTEASPACFSYPCRYLFPYNLHLTAPATTAEPLRIRDSSGNPVAGAPVFTPDDPTLVSVPPSGYVTALRTESPTEIGTWIHASLDGGETANTCVARVLPENYGVAFTEEVGARTILYYPESIAGETIGALVRSYEVPRVNEYAQAIQTDLLRLTPFGGCRQIYEVDFGATEQSRVCGISGNPIRLGWNIAGNAWQNCFLVPFLPPRSPQWGVFYHELGHNFTWAAPAFATSLGIFHYSEGLATVASVVTMGRILDNSMRYPVGTAARDSLRFVHDRDVAAYLGAYQNWLNAGADFAELNPDIVDGLWLHHAGANASRFAGRFFLPLAPGSLDGMGAALCGAISDTGRHTFFAALISAAAGEDLSATFSNTYHYPIDPQLFAAAYDGSTGVLAAAAAGRIPGGADLPGQPLRVAKGDAGGISLTWDPSCVAADTDYAVYEGTLGLFFSHTSRFCSTLGSTTKAFAPPAGSAYYLVVPRNSANEGSYGMASSGRERPQGAGSCAPQVIAFCP